MGDIKAIETLYHGCWFRSRLEARWAVFFDALGVQWQYETEGFDLGKAGWYLPDFYFQDMYWYGEVKPDRYFSDADALKMKTFDDNPPDGCMGLIHLIGVPEMHPGGFTGRASMDSVWHFCGRAGIHDREVIRRAVNLARCARFDGRDEAVYMCEWSVYADGNGDSIVVGGCGYEGQLLGEFPELPERCPRCGGKTGIVDECCPY